MRKESTCFLINFSSARDRFDVICIGRLEELILGARFVPRVYQGALPANRVNPDSKDRENIFKTIRGMSSPPYFRVHV